MQAKRLCPAHNNQTHFSPLDMSISPCMCWWPKVLRSALPVACLWGLSDENGSIIVYKLRSK